MLSLEETARQSKLGLWADSNSMAPCDYRHGGKQKKADKELRSSDEPAVPQDNDVTCGNKRYCKEMTSCEEAKFYLTQCGLPRLDGDGDGVPCEKLCKR